MEKYEKMRQYIRDHGEQIVQDTIMLAQHQSPTENKPCAEKCADALQQLVLDRLGVVPEQVFAPDDRGRTMFFRVGSGRPKALMIGHYDTVWDLDTLPLKREGNVLRGPGVYDMKFGLVSGIWALKAILETGADLGGCVGLFFNSDEEQGSRTSKDPLKQVAEEFENALILEPGSGKKVKTGRKATGRFTIDVTGVAAHSGTDYQAGCSAILEAARITEKLFALTDYEKGTTVNVGTFHGGTKANVVAAHATLNVDARAKTTAEADRITKIINDLKPTQDRIQLRVEGGFGRPPFEPNEANLKLFAKACDAGKQLGMVVEATQVGGGSDGNYTSSWGIPTLDGLGGVGDGAHAIIEHILIEESLQTTVLLAALAEGL